MKHLYAVLALTLVGCAAPPDRGPGEPPPWMGTGFAADGGAGECGADEHLCDGRCTPEQANDPDLGCARGCGTPCPSPTGGVATCTADGSCGFECLGSLVADALGCGCTPRTCEEAGAQCGAVDDGCGGVIQCGGCAAGVGCVDGQCGCGADDAEPNDADGDATPLGHFTDFPQTTHRFGDWSLGQESDADWYELTVSDEFGDGNPIVTATVGNIPLGAEYELGLWYVCDGGGDDSSCDDGDPDESFGTGCVQRSRIDRASARLRTSCDGLDESGTAIIRVRSLSWMPVCAAYTLDIDVD